MAQTWSYLRISSYSGFNKQLAAEANKESGLYLNSELKAKRHRGNMTDFYGPLRSEIQARRRGRPLLLLLDYDGTLVEIAPRPELARPTPELLELLRRLTAQGDLKVMVVSGRPLRDLQELLPVPGLNFLGSHGGEAYISGRLHPLQVAAADDEELCRWRNRLGES